MCKLVVKGELKEGYAQMQWGLERDLVHVGADPELKDYL